MIKNKLRSIIGMALPLMMTSCALSVTTDLKQTLTPRVEASQVHLYDIGENVPAGAEFIGTIKVTDGGFATNCGLDKAVDLAKKKTAACGGNILQLTEHKLPSPLGSSCHRIRGRMLWMTDTVRWDTAHNAEPMVTVINNQTNTERKRTSKQTNKIAKNTIYGMIGEGWITSKIYMPTNSNGSIKSGLDWTLGYDWVSEDGWGLGAKYSCYHSSCTVNNQNLDVTMTYIAPQVVYKSAFNNWIVEEHFGLGYFNYHPSTNSLGKISTGVGYNFDLGVEYLISKNFGVCTNLGYVGGRLPDMDKDLPSNSNEVGGFFRINLMAGIKMHF